MKSLWDKTGLTSPKCPHCTGLTSNSDDGHHVVSDCAHRILAGQRTHRHNRICYLVCEAIRVAYHANHWHVNVDAGTRFRPGDWSTREIMSPSVLPDDAHAHPQTNNAQPMESTSQDQPSAATSARQPEKQRCTIPLWALPDNTFLPDIVLINGWSPELPVPVTPAEKAKITFVIVRRHPGGDVAIRPLLA